ncbi:porin [Sneathiella glossodoripedis]|uniref:porin n=1 Tax=Sneathiella glossodoripedis TaxID=418853 RepID=UPI00046FEE4E|nr:porin [Sneathiella glossodoripedis]
MKKVILGTTALVAASALTAGTASAAEKIKLGLGGYLQTSFVAASYDTGDQLSNDIRHEGEVFFMGSTTLDNGLTFGVNIQLEARESGDQVDETYMYVDGSFGRILMGSENSSSYLMHYASPSPVPAWGLASPNANASGFTTPSTYTNDISDSDKLTYFTPRFGGFQFGVSYTPDGDSETAGAKVYSDIEDEGATDEAYSLGANFNHKFGSVGFKASLGWEHSESTTAEDQDEYSAGVGLDVAGFSIGAAYKLTDNDGNVDDEERHDYNIGLTYGQGPWKVGIQYAGVTLDDASDGQLDAIVVGGQYTLGPGITAFGGVQFWDAEDDLVVGGNEDSTVFFLGTSLSF